MCPQEQESCWEMQGRMKRKLLTHFDLFRQKRPPMNLISVYIQFLKNLQTINYGNINVIIIIYKYTFNLLNHVCVRLTKSLHTFDPS